MQVFFINKGIKIHKFSLLILIQIKIISIKINCTVNRMNQSTENICFNHIDLSENKMEIV